MNQSDDIHHFQKINNVFCLSQVQLISQLLNLLHFIRGGNSRYRAAFDSDGRPCDLFSHSLCRQRIRDPSIIELKGTFCDSFVTIAIGVYSSIPATDEKKQTVLEIFHVMSSLKVIIQQN